MSEEPLIHSHLSDVLPEDHPWAYISIGCFRCGVSLHASNNECMQTWVEWDKVALCTKCCPRLMGEVLSIADFYDDNRKRLKGP